MSKKDQLKSMAVDTPIYRYWNALYLSFYSPQLYVDVVKRWRGFGIIYLLFAITLLSIPWSTRTAINFNHYFEEQILLPIQNLPTLSVQNGGVSFDQPMPYLMKNKKGQVVTIIDTTGVINEMKPIYPQLSILITKNNLYFRPPELQQFLDPTLPSTGNKIYTRSFNEEADGIFDGKHWIASSHITKLNTFAKTLIFPAIPLFFAIIYCISVIAFSTIGQLCADIFLGIKLTFKESCRLFAVASTPQIILLFAIHTANLMFQGLGYIYLILLIAYFFYALLTVKREQQNNN